MRSTLAASKLPSPAARAVASGEISTVALLPGAAAVPLRGRAGLAFGGRRGHGQGGFDGTDLHGVSPREQGSPG